MDGKSRQHNKYRKFKKNKNLSTYKAIINNLKDIPRALINITAVYTFRNYKNILENARHFVKSGINNFTFSPNIFDSWSNNQLRGLDASLNDYYNYLFEIYEEKKIVIPQFPKRKDNLCNKLIINSSGKYIVCDKSLYFIPGALKKFEFGSITNVRNTLLSWQEKVDNLFVRCYTCSFKQYCPCKLGIYLIAGKLEQNAFNKLNNFCALAKIILKNEFVFFDRVYKGSSPKAKLQNFL